MSKPIYRKFIDKSCAANLQNGLEYYAAGLIISDHSDTSGISGKDYAVAHIDPWGTCQYEWRAKDEIVISDIDQYDYEYLQICYEDD